MRLLAVIAFCPSLALADSVVAARTIRAQQVIAPGDVALVAEDLPGAVSRTDQAVGREARITLYAGRPVRIADLAAPAIVERNQIVRLGYLEGGLQIRAEGRALARGRVGEVVRVMNLGSRATVSGRIAPDGTILVGDAP